MKKLFLTAGLLASILNANAFKFTNGHGPLDDSTFGSAGQRGIVNVADVVWQNMGSQQLAFVVLEKRGSGNYVHLDTRVGTERLNGKTVENVCSQQAPLTENTPFISSNNSGATQILLFNEIETAPSASWNLLLPVATFVSMLSHERSSSAVGTASYSLRDGLVRAAKHPGATDYINRVFAPRPITETSTSTVEEPSITDEAMAIMQEELRMLELSQNQEAATMRGWMGQLSSTTSNEGCSFTSDSTPE